MLEQEAPEDVVIAMAHQATRTCRKLGWTPNTTLNELVAEIMATQAL